VGLAFCKLELEQNISLTFFTAMRVVAEKIFEFNLNQKKNLQLRKMFQEWMLDVGFVYAVDYLSSSSFSIFEEF
jgi:hypothetical protein